jgi:hypothetical protein
MNCREKYQKEWELLEKEEKMVHVSIGRIFLMYIRGIVDPGEEKAK